MIYHPPTTVLETFVTVAETRNFSTAARILHRTQPAVSHQIKKLEENVARKLFSRSANTVELTAEGEVLLRFAKQIVALSETARNCMTMQLPTTEVRVGAPDDYLTGFLQQPLAALAKEFPNASLTVRCENSRDLIRKWELGEFDVSIVATDPDRPLGKTLLIDDLIWVASAGWHSGSAVLPLSGYPRGCHVRDVMIRTLDAVRRPWRFVFSSDSISAIRDHVVSGLSISAVERTLLPEGAVDIGQQIRLPALAPIRVALLKRENHYCEIQARLVDLVEKRFANSARSAALLSA